MAFDAELAEDKVRRRKAMLRSRLIGLGITVAVMVGFYLWQRDQFTGVGWIVVYALGLSISVGFVVGHLIAYLLARQELAEIGNGVALRIGRPGVVIGDAYAPWAEVTALTVVKGKLGHGPRLQLTRTGGPPASVALDFLDVRPATLDSTARAYSAGRHGVDLSALDT